MNESGRLLGCKVQSRHIDRRSSKIMHLVIIPHLKILSTLAAIILSRIHLSRDQTKPTQTQSFSSPPSCAQRRPYPSRHPNHGNTQRATCKATTDRIITTQRRLNPRTTQHPRPALNPNRFRLAKPTRVFSAPMILT